MSEWMVSHSNPILKFHGAGVLSDGSAGVWWRGLSSWHMLFGCLYAGGVTQAPSNTPCIVSTPRPRIRTDRLVRSLAGRGRGGRGGRGGEQHGGGWGRTPEGHQWFQLLSKPSLTGWDRLTLVPAWDCAAWCQVCTGTVEPQRLMMKEN